MRLIRSILTQVGFSDLAVVIGTVDGNPSLGDALLPAVLQPSNLEITFLLCRHKGTEQIGVPGITVRFP